jgi:hypothetical protein
MIKNDLKLLAQCYVEAQTPSQKNQQIFFNFINEAENHQIMNFMITGKPEFVTQIDSYNNVKVFQESDLSLILELPQVYDASQTPIPKSVLKAFLRLSKKITGKKPFLTIDDVDVWLSKADAMEVLNMTTYLMTAAVGVSALIIATLIGYILRKIADRTLSKAARVCNSLKGKDKTKCMYKFKVEVIKNQAAVLQKSLTACKKTKNPAVCKAEINSKLTGLKSKIDKLNKKRSKLG